MMRQLILKDSMLIASIACTHRDYYILQYKTKQIYYNSIWCTVQNILANVRQIFLPNDILANRNNTSKQLSTYQVVR